MDLCRGLRLGGGLLPLTALFGELTIPLLAGVRRPARNGAWLPRAGGESVGGKDRNHRDFVAGLTSGERLLITLRGELYEGSWEKMLQDLRDRLEKRPYIFKLSSRIETDMTAIEKMSSYEEKHGVKLSDYLGSSSDDSASDEQET